MISRLHPVSESFCFLFELNAGGAEKLTPVVKEKLS